MQLVTFWAFTTNIIILLHAAVQCDLILTDRVVMQLQEHCNLFRNIARCTSFINSFHGYLRTENIFKKIVLQLLTFLVYLSIFIYVLLSSFYNYVYVNHVTFMHYYTIHLLSNLKYVHLYRFILLFKILKFLGPYRISQYIR